MGHQLSIAALANMTPIGFFCLALAAFGIASGNSNNQAGCSGLIKCCRLVQCMMKVDTDDCLCCDDEGSECMNAEGKDCKICVPGSKTKLEPTTRPELVTTSTPTPNSIDYYEYH